MHCFIQFFVEVKILSAARNIMREKFNDFFLDTMARTGQDVVSLMGLRDHYLHVGPNISRIPGLPVVKFVTRERPNHPLHLQRQIIKVTAGHQHF